MFLTSEELSRYTGYPPNQRKRICKFLERRGVKYETNRLGDPVVLKSAIESKEAEASGPDLSWLESA